MLADYMEQLSWRICEKDKKKKRELVYSQCTSEE